MSFSRILCKLWRFFAGVVRAVVDTAVGLIEYTANAILPLLSDLWGALFGDEGIFGGTLGKIALYGGLGLLAYFALTSDKDEEQSTMFFAEKGQSL